jgi:Tfp pilus assembly protein PilF
MKKIFLPMLALSVASPAAAQSITVFSTPPSNEQAALSVAFPELQAGQNKAAVEKLTTGSTVAADDPSRLINLGTAYARLGRADQAAAMFRNAMTSPIRYDLELADGRYMDSRWAARAALAHMRGNGPQLALAQ